MCTSFVSYYDKVIYGMNYDFKRSKTYVIMRTNGTTNTLLFYCEAADEKYSQYLVNSNGLFFCLQNINNCSLNYETEKSDDVVDYIDLTHQMLFANSIDSALSIMNNKGLFFPYRFRVPINSLQSLVADKNGNAVVLNYDQKSTYVTMMREKHMVMTNFANCLEKPKEDGIFKEVYRYDTVDAYIRNKKETLDVEGCFKVLDKTRNDLFSYTLFSAVADIPDSVVYLCINREFQKTCKINLLNGKLSNYQGYEQDFEIDLVDNLVLLENFNENIRNNIVVTNHNAKLPV